LLKTLGLVFPSASLLRIFGPVFPWVLFAKDLWASVPLGIVC